MRRTDPTVVIGAGWSGLACAVQLVRQGGKAIVLDAAPQPGGRARALDHELGGGRMQLNNGQHLLLGAYRDTLELLRTVGVARAAALAQMPFSIAYPDGWRLAAARARAPWHLALGLIGARGASLAQRWALAAWARRQQRAGWAIVGDMPGAALFDRHPPELVRRLWRPLCLAALNIELEHASARIFLNVLRDSLGADAPSSDLLLPRTDLSTLFPGAAVQWLRARGAHVRLHAPVLEVRAAAPGAACRVVLRGEVLAAGSVVLAVPPDRAAALLDATHRAADPTVAALRALQFAPICTSYLRYAPSTRLPRDFFALLDDASRGHFAQWVFDRGALDPALGGVLSAVISGAGAHLELTRGAIGQRVAAQLSADFGLPMPLDHFTIIEKHATLVPAPGLRRPGVRLPLPGLFLAGDSAESPYPSTIEGSVRAGIQAAQEIAIDSPELNP